MIDVSFLTEENNILITKLKKASRTIQNLRDENTSLRAVSRLETRNDNLEDKILEVFEQNVKKVKPKVYTYQVEKSREYYPDWGNVVGISDWHIGEEVDKAQVSGSNEFNYKVSYKRISTYIKKIKNTRTVRSKNLVIADLGDNIRGIIHGGIADTEGGLMESIVKAVDLQSMFINEMLDTYESIDYRFVVGNHSRLDDAISSKDKYKDYSWLITQMLIRLYTDEPRINFNVSESGFHLVKINTANILMFHGDTHRSYNPSNNGARLQMQDTCNALFGKSARHFLSGHRHIAMNIQNQYEGQNIVSGTLVGNNEYGVQNGFSTISASQVMFNVEKDGKVEDIFHYNLK